MRKLTLAALFATACLAVPAAVQAQDTSSDPSMSTTDTSGPSAPDGSKAFGLVPYFGVMGGYESFDNQRSKSGIPQAVNSNGSIRNNYHLAGGLVEGVAGVNIPLGPLFAGVEGSVAKGFTGNIDWEYGAFARGGFRAGDSGLFYGKFGYRWVNFDHFASYTTASTNHDYHDWEYGIGFEAGPKDIGLGGLTNRAGVRLRGEVTTFGDFRSIRPMLGVITHF